MSLGPHAAFIVAAYLAAIIILGGMIAWVMLDLRQLRRHLGDLEARGARSRSTQAAPAAQ